jgi:hypothetical protein
MVVQGLQLTYQPSRFSVYGEKGKTVATGNFATQTEARYIEPLSGDGDSNLFLRTPAKNSSQHYYTKKDYSTYRKNRERIFGLHFWGNSRSKVTMDPKKPIDDNPNPNKHEIDEIWIGEGFSPIEVVEILGLNRAQFDPMADIEKITGTYSTK